MDGQNILSQLVRIGTVSAVDSDKKRVRVIYEGIGFTSGWLSVLQQPQTAIDIETAGTHSHSVSTTVISAIAGGVDTSHSHATSTTVSENGEHTHAAKTIGWMPEVNARVLVLLLPIRDGDGFVLGVIT